jgi:heat-inducible transcriptional repressor
LVLELNNRSQEIFRYIVDAFLETGAPIGSRTLARRLNMALSPATIRNVMADLEEAGLLFAPHTSAGRLPTEAGLRLFVDGLLEIGNLDEDERKDIEARCAGSGRSVETMLEEVTTTLSGLSHCAGLVVAPKTESPLKHIEFVNLSPGRALVILITENGVVENRVIEAPSELPSSALVEATNFLSARLVGKTLSEVHERIEAELKAQQQQLDVLTKSVVEAGLATWAGGDNAGSLIVRGQANLLTDINGAAELEHIRTLFNALETKETMLRFLSLADGAEGVQIFIGAENEWFNIAGCSMVVAPYRDPGQRIVGAIGVIGPSRMNYTRIIPMVDYTSKLIGRLMG